MTHMAFKMLRQQDAMQSTVRELEARVSSLVEHRHEYPMWPLHGDYFVDEYERLYHEPVRKEYYKQTLFLLRILRILREAR